MPCFLKARVQFLPKNQSQEAAEDMPTDRLIGLMKNRPCFQDRLHVPERVLYLPEFLVLESDHVGGKIRIRTKNPLAVIAGFFFDLCFFDGDIVTDQLEVFAVSRFPTRALGPFLSCDLRDSMIRGDPAHPSGPASRSGRRCTGDHPPKPP